MLSLICTLAAATAGSPPSLPPIPHFRRYTALVFRPTNLTAALFTLALAANGTTASGTTTFAEDVRLPAGPYRLQIATTNTLGAGANSGLSDAFTVGAWLMCLAVSGL